MCDAHDVNDSGILINPNQNAIRDADMARPKPIKLGTEGFGHPERVVAEGPIEESEHSVDQLWWQSD